MEKMYYELSAPQKAIWLTEQYYQSTNVNNVCGTFYSTEKLDFDLLKKSLNVFLQCNDSFRIQLTQKNNEIKQYFCNLQDIDFDVVNIANKEEQTALEEKIASGVFDMLNSLLFKIILFRYPDGHGGFVINSHHIISDSWTNGIVANDVALIYAKLKKGEVYEKDESLSYKTYLQAEADYQSSTKFEKDKTYWESVFQTVPEVASIPSTKETVKGAESLEACRVLLPLDNDILVAIRTYCEKNKVSLYNFFMTIFALYLGRVSGLDEFVIGTPILNRTNFKEKQTTGMFINTLPLKINLVYDKTFLDNLKDIAVRSMSLLRHQKYSFQYILEDVRKKDSDLPRLYNVMYSYQITKMNETVDALPHTTSWIFNRRIADDLDIHMFEWNENNAIQIAYDYRTNKYNEKDILDIHARILHIIEQVITNTSIILKDVEIVTPDEKQKILCQFNNTAMDYPKDKTIVDLFEEQVEKTPDNVAVVFEQQRLTYRELNEKANGLAKIILDKHIVSESIGVLLDKSADMVIAILAILKSGNNYVPMNPTFPDARIQLMKDATNCHLVLTSEAYQEKCENMDTFLVDATTSIKENIHYASPDDTAYIIFTSGTTGVPKGVEVHHKSIVNTLFWRKNYYHFGPSTKTLQLPAFSFDSSVEDIFTTLISGGLLVLPSDSINNVDGLIKDIETHHISHFLITPALYAMLLDKDCSSIHSLDFVTVAGESFDMSLVKKHFSVFPKTRLMNEYGPTENSVCSTIYEFTNTSTSVLLGKPISNVFLYVVSSTGQLCPIGVPGELWLGGAGITEGYLNNSALTKEKFINNPFGSGKVYKTGDFVAWTASGNLRFIDRTDNQVKIRGFRIELGEITSAIMKYEGIKQATTILHTIHNTKRLCSYIVADKHVNTADLKQFLAKTLANYMVPTYVMQLDALPLNINGKIDKTQLPTPTLDTLERDVVAPRNALDDTIIQLLATSLDLKNISITDHFFDIGVDSLSAIALASSLSSSLNIPIGVKEIFNYPTTQKLSDYIASISTVQSAESIVPAAPRKYYPLSSAQKRIYYSCMKDKTSLLYNTAGGLVFEKSLDKKKIENAFKTLIQRHSSLRTFFETKNNEVVQSVAKSIDFSLDFEKATSNDIDQIYASFVQPFDLSKAPLFRVKLVEFNNGSELLLLDMHHIISDGTSLNIIVKELGNLYNNISLSEKNLEYKDFAVWEQSQIQNTKRELSKKYWKQQFTGDIPLLNMPTDYPRPAVQRFEGDNYCTTMDTTIYHSIIDTAQKLNITPYMLLLSVYYITLSKYTSQEDIVIGTPMSGRELPELSELVGMFVTSLPLRHSVDTKLTFTEFCNSVKKLCIDAFSHQDYPFNDLVNDLHIARDPSRNPLFDTMFIYQSEGYPTARFGNISAEYFIPNNPISKFDLSLEIVPINEEYHMRYEYSTNLFSRSFIEQFARHYNHILQAILENSDVPIANIDMLSEKEKYDILYTFNNTTVDYPRDKSIIQLFEEQVNKTPHKVALVFENHSLTYRELNEKANQLANFLIANNTGLGDIVCILLDKSLEMIVSILGILKIGATFLPIDVNYPKERIDYMLRDSKSNILLTSQDLAHKANDTVQVLTVELDNTQFSQYSDENVGITYDSDNLAYIMYTSGSTGRPKGVMVTHRNVVRLIKNSTFVKLGKDERILQTGSIVFDACTFEIWAALLNGYPLFIMKKDHLLDARLLEQYLLDNNISTLWLTAPLFNQLSESNPYMFKNVKNLLTGGDVLSPKHINMVMDACPNLTIINGYGPTENTTFSCCFAIDKKYKQAIPIGRPISNSTAYVVSPTGALCPVGVPGELWVGGDGVSKGYLNNDALTQEKFIPNPFGNGIVYKTGDLVKWLPDGTISFIGRIDNQVKIRGFRVELNEINKTLLEHEDIKESYTTIKMIDNIKYICSYIVTNTKIDINDLRLYLGKHLPSYMIPTYFVTMNKLPINQNGKVDKNALPLDVCQTVNNSIIEQPSSPEEILLLNMFREILKNDTIGTTDSFFDVGGDSLTAMKLQIEAMSKNINISYADIFQFPTVKELAKTINLDMAHHETSSLQNYSKYDILLSKNTVKPNLNCVSGSVGNVLLTGFTGFLGAHILDSFLKKETGNIYCLIRSKNNMSARERLFNVLHFYFNDTYDALVDDRILVVEGDITLPHLGLSEEDYRTLGSTISTVIHSAALVKHYGVYRDFEQTNVTGTKTILSFAKDFQLKFIHVSTLSVSGNELTNNKSMKSHNNKEVSFNETNFYIGQSLDNLYVRSKFEAEQLVFDATLEGLPACVLRMGNITSRFSDGKFQQNHFENAFINRLKTFIQLGIFPKELLSMPCEFSPVDYCAEAIINIVRHFNPDYTVFHLYNEKLISMDRLFDMLHELGIPIHLVTQDEFSHTLQEYLSDPDKKQVLTGIANDLSADKKLTYESEVQIQSDFTQEYLYKTGFEWPYIDIHYIRSLAQYLLDIGYFNIQMN